MPIKRAAKDPVGFLTESLVAGHLTVYDCCLMMREYLRCVTEQSPIIICDGPRGDIQSRKRAAQAMEIIDQLILIIGPSEGGPL